MAKVLEALIAKGRRAKRPQDQKEIAFGLADLSTHGQFPLLSCYAHNKLYSYLRGVAGAYDAERWCEIPSYPAPEVD